MPQQQDLPAHTLFVAQSWSGNPPSSTFFTSIADALAQAATLLPSAAEPVAIVVFPGTYLADLHLMSNVHISGPTTGSVIVAGNITYNPGIDVNVAFANDSELVNLDRLTLNGSVSIDARSKPSNMSNLVFRDCAVNGAVTSLCRASLGPNRDQITYISGGIGAGAQVHTDAQVNTKSCRYHGMTFNGDCRFSLDGGDYAYGATDSTTVNGTSSGTVTGLNVSLPWQVNSTGAPTEFIGCQFTGSSTLAVAAGATADVRASECEESRMSGAGTINRKSITMSVGPTAHGANTVPFAVALPDGDYRVALQLTSGPGGSGAIATSKTGTGFTLSDPGGGSTYDVIVMRD